ncbi:non-hydrolyzing UDP-N-acetylglucosamine 2-epimerase [Cyanobacterium sp. uoEpiScrs1]|uniref:non-hydrolyzing UDP-N-acetylglucosamine 2-epimerase n=1 Tax=Cyanobacterium sp. uoEpiScrs1 TaxID=2976343 RepID=UPI002269C511|nr:UDP-N-acetylglucosamine 2-epimerase (non-hydrolyzing) [Cyanobacterium sp. uoEpiScrs1]
MTSVPYSICITLGTRPEAIKLAPVIKKFRQLSVFETHVVLTGQHREMVEQVMKLFEFELEGDHNLKIMQPHQTLTDITYRSLQGLEAIFNKIQPQLIIVQGDTTTTFAAALAAFYQQIPIGHVEAGLRTDNIYNPFPEEANRRLVSQLAQLHFAPTQLAVENLKRSGVTGEIHLTGNTVIDALLTVAKKQQAFDIKGLDINNRRLLLATVHRRENWGQPLQDILTSFRLILDKYPDTILLLPMHRNPIVREPIQKVLKNHPRVFLTEPLSYRELVIAIQNCYLLLTDSGGLQEEAPSLGKPVLVLRDTTERPEAIEAGTAKLVGTNSQNILKETGELLSNKNTYEKMANAINPFGDGKASDRILKIVQHYLVEKEGKKYL